MQNERTLAARLLPLWTLLLILAYQPQASGQQPGQTDQVNCTTITQSKDFPFLAGVKGTLSAQIQELKGRLAALPAEIDEALPKEELEANRKELGELEDKPNMTPEERVKFERLRVMETVPIDAKEPLEEELNAKRVELVQKESLLQCVEQRISSIWTPEQAFKLWMSAAGAAMIALVIAGFFILSYKDEQIRRAIFSGQTGIQFLTLFSIVIAIILFGITGILHDKELAALLGGLSGYILGRYNSQGGKEPDNGGDNDGDAGNNKANKNPPPNDSKALLPPAEGTPD